LAPYPVNQTARRHVLARSSGSDENKNSYAARAARVYATAYDWSDEPAIEACINVDITHTAQVAALGRLCDTLGVPRTVARFQLVRILYFSLLKRLTQVEVANEMMVTSANVTFLVDGLEKDQLVRRVPSLTDRRTVYVELTESGELLAERIVPSMARFMGRLMEGFSDEEKHQLSGLINRLRCNAEAFESRSID
jgi:DNA-binding MarR family transcriptional regulator